MASKPVLNEKQATFVVEYVKDLNATNAAIRAGYSPKTAYSQGHRLLKHADVAEAIFKAKEQRSIQTEIDSNWVLRNAVDLYDKAMAKEQFAVAAQVLKIIGQHVDVQAFLERKEVTHLEGRSARLAKASKRVISLEQDDDGTFKIDEGKS